MAKTFELTTLLKTIRVPEPKKSAQLFCGILGADKGVQAIIRKDADGYTVIADDGKGVKFTV